MNVTLLQPPDNACYNRAILEGKDNYDNIREVWTVFNDRILKPEKIPGIDQPVRCYSGGDMEACSQALGLGGHWGRNGSNCCWCICPKDKLGSSDSYPARTLVDLYHLAHMVPPDHVLSARTLIPFPFACPGYWLDEKGVRQSCGKLFRNQEVRV